MKKLNYLLLFLGVATMFFGACTPTYLPNAVNTPLLGHKGEIAGNVQGTLNGWNVQGAYGITKHIGVMAGAQFKGNKIGIEIPDTSGGLVLREEKFQHYFVEAGAGYFGKIAKIGRYGVWGGAGFGSTKTLDIFLPDLIGGGDIEYIQGQYVRAFVTPEVGLKTKVFDLSFTPRLSYVNFVKTLNIDAGTLSPGNNSNLFLEPVLTARVGYRWVKFTTSIGASVPLMNVDAARAFKTQPFIWTAGIQFNIFAFKGL